VVVTKVVDLQTSKFSPFIRRVWVAGVLVLLAVLTGASSPAPAEGLSAELIKQRHMGAARGAATPYPRGEGDQAMVSGWPLYRTERGQAAFNDAMATLQATVGPQPTPADFKGCVALQCAVSLPAITAEGWLPAGRLWVSPTEYVLIAHSPRDSRSFRRRMPGSMTYFVFHEFHNSSRNVDLYDTISSHSGGVFVPLYMGKAATDAAGHRFVVVVQVAPYDVHSIHASNMGSAGPGIEVARNPADPVEPLQNLAGSLVAMMAKSAAPRLRVVNHRGSEGQPMLRAYEQRQAAWRARADATSVTLPFTPAASARTNAAKASLGDLILRPGAQPRLALAERRFMQPAVDAIAALLRANPPPPTRTGVFTLVEPHRLVPRPNCAAASRPAVPCHAALDGYALIEAARPVARP
jgi:hypothetical protein